MTKHHTRHASPARRPRDVQRVNVDFKRDMLAEIDREVARLGITRQGWIKSQLARVLERGAR